MSNGSKCMYVPAMNKNTSKVTKKDVTKLAKYSVANPIIEIP